MQLFSKHLETILTAILTATIVFTADYIYTDNKQKAVLTVQLEALTKQVLEMRADIRSLQIDYAKAGDVIKLEERVRAIERKVR